MNKDSLTGATRATQFGRPNFQTNGFVLEYPTQMTRAFSIKDTMLAYSENTNQFIFGQTERSSQELPKSLM